MFGVEAPTKFSVEVGPKLFKTLTSNLYSDKIYAVIREISTNGYESHQENGNPEEPFSVRLPSAMNTVFSIRDYGTGLSQEGIARIYTRLFKSTKDDSNEQSGFYGIGSCAPFSYVSSFIVHSYYEGFKYVYFLMMKDGIPTYSLASKEPTTERSGLEIIIDCKRNDITQFVRTAERVYKWFDVKPKVTGNSDYKEQQKPKPVISGTKWDIMPTTGQWGDYGSVAVMGNVAYSLKSYTGANKDVLINSLVLYFDIGDIEPEPSREGLSFDPQTLKAIENKLSLVKAEIKDNIEKEVASSPNYWAACKKCNALNKYYPISAVKWNGVVVDNYIPFGNKIDPATNVLVRRYYECYTSGRRVVQRAGEAQTHQEAVFVVNDMARGIGTRVTSYLNNSKYVKAYICPNTPDEIKIFCDVLRLNSDQLTLASTLPAVVFDRNSRAGHQTKVLQLVKAESRATYCWKDAEIDIETGAGYYVPIFNNMVVAGDKTYHPNALFSLANKLDKTMVIYGFRPNITQKIGPNWKLAIPEVERLFLNEYNTVKGLLETKASVDLVERSARENFHHNIKLIYSLVPQSEIKSLYEKFRDLRNTLQLEQTKAKLTSINELHGLLLQIGCKECKVKQDTTLKSEFDVALKKYPLLSQSFELEHAKELVYYISHIHQFGR